ncbi:LuxR C-terminal-related transcriptional regulator, partial [Eggerthella sinensis]|uniref:LuxR C-terminal-related transcriptional regulator n=1 Tax=Eggerthella sinensis TaxID=242230 RepID=UPI0022E146C3
APPTARAQVPERATAGGSGASELDRAAAAYGLSELETTIFKQLLEGRTIARIAQDLYLSSSAVKYHAQKIYRSCNVHTRSELSALMRPPLPAPPPHAQTRARTLPSLTGSPTARAKRSSCSRAEPPSRPSRAHSTCRRTP